MFVSYLFHPPFPQEQNRNDNTNDMVGKSNVQVLSIALSYGSLERTGHFYQVNQQCFVRNSFQYQRYQPFAIVL